MENIKLFTIKPPKGYYFVHTVYSHKSEVCGYHVWINSSQKMRRGIFYFFFILFLKRTVNPP